MRGAVGAIVGGAAFGVASRVTKSSSRPKVLGVRLPAELSPRRLDRTARAKGNDIKKLAGHADVRRAAKNAVKDVKDVDLKGLARRIGDLAEQVENHSEDVQAVSRQAKRISRRIS